MTMKIMGKLISRLKVVLPGGILLLAGAAAAQTATNFGKVGLCPASQNGAFCSKVLALPPIPVPTGSSNPFANPQIKVLTDGAPNEDFQLIGQQQGGPIYSLTVVFRPKHAGLRRGMVVFTNQSGQTLAEQPIYGIGIGAQLGFGFANQKAIQTGVQDTYGIAVNGAGTVYYSNGETVSKLTLGGSPQTVASGFLAGGMSIDGGGNLYVGDLSYDRLLRISPSGQTSVLMNNVVPISVAVGGSAEVYLADATSQNVLKLASGVTTTVAAGSSYTGVALDGNGFLLVGTADGLAFKIGPDNVTSVIGNSLWPNSLSFAADAASLFAGDKTALVKALEGVAVQLNDEASGGVPQGTAVSGSGNIYYGDPYLRRLVEVDRTPGVLPLSADGQPGTFEIENTGNAVMNIAAIYLEGVRFGTNCTSLQPGASCAFDLEMVGNAGEEWPLQVIYQSGEGPVFSEVTHVQLQSSVTPTFTGRQSLSQLGGVAVQVSLSGSTTAAGPVSFTVGSHQCTVPLSGGSASCDLGPELVTPGTKISWTASYAGDDVTSPVKASGTLTVPKTLPPPGGWNRPGAGNPISSQ